MPTQWRIPNIGILDGSIDRIHLVSSHQWNDIKNSKEIGSICSRCHKFKGVNLHRTPKYHSWLDLTLCPSFDLKLFKRLEREMPGLYTVTQVELAFDIIARSIKDAWRILLWLTRHVGKRNHQRSYVDWYVKEKRVPPPGCLRLPTIYFEHGSSTVRLKVYARHVKLPDQKFGEQIVVRLEWTLVDKEAVERHLGGNTIDHLLKANLNSFLKRNLVLASINENELGRLLVPNKANSYLGGRNSTTPKRSWATIGANRLMKRWTEKSLVYLKKDDTFINREMQKSILLNPAHVKRQLKARRTKKRGDGFTDYRIAKCFTPIPLRPRLHKRVITTQRPK